MPQNEESLSREDRVNEAIVEFLEAEQRGEAPQVGAYLLRYPEQARSLRSFFENYRRLRSIAPELDARHASTVVPVEAVRDTSQAKPVAEPRRTSNLAPEAPAFPQEFGRYRVERLLGTGGMGAVYLAEDLQLHRKVALKVPALSMVDDPDLASRFEREARAAAVLRHPNICTVYDVGEFNGVRYLTMAYIDGAPLSKVISSSKPIPPRKVAAAIWKLALALQHAHDHGIVHRDLKSANVMIDKRGDPILMDFGLARFTTAVIDVRLTQSGAILGTPAYMSPEHWSGDTDQVGPAADVYGLGIIFYELLTGRLPFLAPIAQLVKQILFTEAPPPSQYVAGLPSVLEEICLKMIAKQPADRYARMSAAADDLAAYLRNPDAAAISPLPTPLPAPPGDAAVRVNDTTRTFVDTVGPLDGASLPARQPSRANLRKIVLCAGAGASLVVALIAVALHWMPSGQVPIADTPVALPPGPVNDQPAAQPADRSMLPPLDAPPGKELRLDRTLIGAKAPGVAIDFSSNGRLIAAAFEDGQVRVWNLETGEIAVEFDADPQPRALLFLPDDDRLVIVPGGGSRQATVWSVQSGQQVDTFEAASDILSCAALSSTAGLMAAGTETQGVLVWDLAERTLRPLPARPEPVSAVAFLPDGKTLLSGEEDGCLAVIPLDGAAGDQSVAELRGHTARITAIAPFTDNRHALTSSVNGELWLWDLQTGQKWKEYGRHEGGVGSTRLMPGENGYRYAVSGCLDGLLQIWDFEERRVVHEVGSGVRQGAVALSADGRWIAAFGGIQGRDKDDPKIAEAVTVHVWRVPMLPGPRGSFPGLQDQALRRPTKINPLPPPPGPAPISEIPFLGLVHELAGHTGPVTSVCMTADGRFGFSSGGWPKGDRVIRKWDLQTGKEVGFVATETDFVTGITVSPDGNLLFSGSKEGPIRLWNGVTGGELIRIPGVANGTAMTQNGLLGFSIADNGVVSIWDLDPSKKKPRTLLGLNIGTVVRLSPNEQLVAAGGQGNRICIWNLSTNQKGGKPICTLQILGGVIEDLQFSPDGKWLAAIDTSGGIRIWNVATEQQQPILEGHGKNTPKSENSPARDLVGGAALAFVAEGDYLISAGKDETLRLWHVGSGREVGRQLVPSGYVRNMAAARGTNLLFTAGEPVSADPARKADKSVQVHLWRLKLPAGAGP